MGLRDDQLAAIAAVRAHFSAGVRDVLLQCPTGWGKSFAVRTMATTALERWQTSLFVAPLQEIAWDLHEDLVADGRDVGLAVGGELDRPSAPIVVGLPRTLAKIDLSGFDLVFWDEAHHTAAKTYKALRERTKDARHLALTATPARADGKGLGDMFREMVCGPSIADMVRAGTLAPMDVVAAAEGELRNGELACEPHEAWVRWGRGQPAIVFCRSKAHAEHVAKPWGTRAMVLNDSTPRDERKRARERISGGDLDALCVIGIGLEGFNCPALVGAILARGVGSLADYLQMCGRPRRVKPWSYLIDLAGSIYLHGLPDEDRVWSLEKDGCRLARPKASITVQRCKECLAVFFPCARCPACGASTEGASVIPRTLSRVDRLALVDDVPVAVSDRAYMRKMREIATGRMRLRGEHAEEVARELFFKRWKREPVAA